LFCYCGVGFLAYGRCLWVFPEFFPSCVVLVLDYCGVHIGITVPKEFYETQAFMQFMHPSFKKQIEVLKLLQQHTPPTEIHQTKHIPITTVCYIRDNTPKMLDNLIEKIHFAVQNSVLDKHQAQKLRKVLSKL
jgi:hypothetical protein